jgi:hypothetical protein
MHLVGEPFMDSPGTSSAEAFRDSVSSRFDAIIIKPGYRDIHMPGGLTAYQDSLNAASDWWHENNPGKIFCITTAPPLRHPTDYSSTASWPNNAGGISDAENEVSDYHDFSVWLTGTWVDRHPENRALDFFTPCVNATGDTDEQYFTKDIYKASDHHLNSAGSDVLQGILADFINGLEDPAISSFTGTVFDGESIVLSGVNFGDDGPSVSIFADFEEASNGDDLFTGAGSANYGTWDQKDGTDGVYSNATSVSGSLSARFNDPSFNYLGETFSSSNRELLLSWWLYLPSGDYYPGEPGAINWKQLWVAGDDIDDDDLVIPTQLSASSWLVNGNDPDPGYSNYTDIGFQKGRWSRITVWMKGGTSSSSDDGNFHLWYLNEDDEMTHQESDDSANILAADGAWERARINGYAYGSDPCHPTFDDVYIASGDNARARVEIGNASAYTSCTNMTILRPTAWSDTEITAVVNQGSFADGDTAYVFVVDADGDVSDGEMVVIGASSSGSIEGLSASVTTGTMSGSWTTDGAASWTVEAIPASGRSYSIWTESASFSFPVGATAYDVLVTSEDGPTATTSTGG